MNWCFLLHYFTMPVFEIEIYLYTNMLASSISLWVHCLKVKFFPKKFQFKGLRLKSIKVGTFLVKISPTHILTSTDLKF